MERRVRTTYASRFATHNVTPTRREYRDDKRDAQTSRGGVCLISPFADEIAGRFGGTARRAEKSEFDAPPQSRTTGRYRDEAARMNEETDTARGTDGI